MKKIYLAGGFASNWQSKVDLELKDFAEVFNPREKEINNNMSLMEYVSWDLHHISNADIVFAFMERKNPSGFGLSVEIGYARALNKTIILVLEDDHEIHSDKSLAFLKGVSSVSFNELNKGLNYLKTYLI